MMRKLFCIYCRPCHTACIYSTCIHLSVFHIHAHVHVLHTSIILKIMSHLFISHTICYVLVVTEKGINLSLQTPRTCILATGVLATGILATGILATVCMDEDQPWYIALREGSPVLLPFCLFKTLAACLTFFPFL